MGNACSAAKMTFPPSQSAATFPLGVSRSGAPGLPGVTSCTEKPSGVFDASDPSPNGEWDEDLLGGTADHVDGGVTLFRRRRYIEEHEFIGTLCVVSGSKFDGIASVAKVDEVDALDDAAGVDIKAWNYSSCDHR